MKILYIDEAGNTGLDLDNEQQPIFTLGGIVIDEKDWYELNHYIQQAKKEISPDLSSAEIHASDIFNSSRNIQKGFDFRKNSYQDNLKTLEKIVDMIVSLNLDIFCYNINKRKFIQNLKDYNLYIEDYIPEPYVHSFIRTTVAYNDYLIKNDCNGMIFKDEITSVEKEIEIVYEKILSGETPINNIIENALSLDSNKSTFIQIADICNFYINKYYSITLYDKVKNLDKKEHCLKQFKKLVPFIHFIDDENFI